MSIQPGTSILAALLLTLPAAGVRAAQSCTENVTDAAKCGTQTVTNGAQCGTTMLANAAVCGMTDAANSAKCGTATVTSAAQCGTHDAADAVACGTKTVTSVAECGYSGVLSIGQCIEKCGTHPGKDCCKIVASCDVAKTCAVPNTCTVANTCLVPKTCAVPNTCKVANSCKAVTAACSLIPDAWKLELLAAAQKKLATQIAQAEVNLANATIGGTEHLADAEAKLKGASAALKPFAKQIGERTARWKKVIGDKDSVKLIEAIVARVAEGKIDAELKSLVKRLDGLLRIPPTKGSRGTDGFARGPALRAASLRRAPGDPAEVRAPLESSRLLADASAPTDYSTVSFEVVVSLNAGLAVGGTLGIGVAWDTKDNVKGVVQVGGVAGAIEDVTGDISYSVSAGDISNVAGAYLGATVDAALVVGGVANIQWGVTPPISPIPTWGVGVTVGEGVGGGITFGGEFLFP